MPRMNAIGVPLLKLGRDISLTSDRWVDVDPSTFTPEVAAEYANLRMRGLIGLHPDDNGGIPVGKTEAPRRAATPMPSGEREDEEPLAPASAPADDTTTRDETPSKRRR